MFRIFTEIDGGVTGHRTSYVKADGKVLEFNTEYGAENFADALRAGWNPYATFEQTWTVEPIE